MNLCGRCKRLISRHSRFCVHCRSDDLHDAPVLQDLERTTVADVSLSDQRYRIDGLIRKGGFGYIFQTSQPSKRQPFALKAPLSFGKVFGLSCGATDQQVEASERMLAKEIETLFRYAHNNIVSIYRAGVIQADSGGRSVRLPAFLMELAEGNAETLLQKLPGLALAERVRIVQDTARGMSYLHRRKVIYRDLSLKNLLVVDRETEGIHYVIADFGTAKKMDSQTRASLTGTGRYLDPAYLLNPRALHNDPRVDVYSLGVMAFELMLGVPDWTALYEEDGAAGIGIDVSSEVIAGQRCKGALPAAVAQVLEQATRRDVEARFKDAAEFSGAFDQALKQSDVLPVRPRQEQAAQKERIQLRATVTLPFSLGEETYAVERQRFAQGQPIELDDPRGAEILLPDAFTSPRVTERKAPSFYEIYSPAPNTLFVRLNERKLRETLGELAAFDETVHGSMTFSGEVEIES